MIVGNYRGKQLFAGRLFAGRLFGPRVIAAAVGGGGGTDLRARRDAPLPYADLYEPIREQQREEDDLVIAMIQAIYASGFFD